MTAQDILRLAEEFIARDDSNVITEKNALSERSIGLRMYAPPLLAFGAADDPLFSSLREPGAVGPHFRPPAEWVPGAKTVVSFFLPFTDRVKESNRRDFSWPSEEWMHARIEGQQTVMGLSTRIAGALSDAGYPSVVPSGSPDFWSRSGKPYPELGEDYDRTLFTSNWSERHVAHVCGLGTFGLSKGLITERGVAGRFGSVVTTLALTPTARRYSDTYEYCTNCGACIENCPVSAITPDGKAHPPCSSFLNGVLEKHRPHYGCGKCQVSVPCEHSIPV